MFGGYYELFFFLQCNSFLLCLQSPTALPPRLLHRGAIKLAVAPMQPISFLMISHCPSASFPTAEKKEEKTGGSC
jgi:hypothetical protein